jgi:hypothetical protein
MGSWKVLAQNTAPTVGAVTPAVATTTAGTAQEFSAIYSDVDGFANLKTLSFQVAVGTSKANGIWALYDQNMDQLTLKDDAGLGLVAGSCTPGMAGGTLSNSQGTLNCAQTTVVKAGKTLTIHWSITPKATFAAATPKGIRTSAMDNSLATSGVVSQGQWQILAGAQGAKAMIRGPRYTVLEYLAMDNNAPQVTIRDEVLAANSGYQLSVDAEMGVMGSGDDLGIAVKQSSGMTQELLTGSYTVVRHSLSAEGPVLFEYLFDGTGEVTIRPLMSQGDQPTRTASYTLAADGTLSLDGMAGQVQADGQALALVDFLAVDNPAMVVGVRQTPGISMASINGDYAEVAPDEAGFRGGMTFDGAGTWHDESGAGGYSVDETGMVQACGMQGILAPGGDFMLLVGSGASGSGMKLLVKRGR